MYNNILQVYFGTRYCLLYMHDRLKLSDWEISVLGFKHVRKSTVGGPDADRSFANMRVCALPQNMFAKTFTKCMSSSMICLSCMRFTIVFL